MIIPLVSTGMALLLSTFFALGASSNELPELAQSGPLQERSYLSIVINLKRDGSFDVVKATRIPGEVILRDYRTSDFVYEVSSGGTTLAVAFFPEDPFLVRAFADPDNAKENTSQGESAVITVNVPWDYRSLAAVRKLRLRIFKLLPGTTITTINPKILAELKTHKKLDLISGLHAKKFGRSISEKLTTIRN